MNVIVHFQKNGIRDEVFLANHNLFSELVDHLFGTLETFGDVAVLCQDPALATEIHSLTGRESRILDSSMKLLDGEKLRDWSKTVVETVLPGAEPEPALIVSPFAGMVTGARIASFLDSAGKRQAFSLSEIGSNANPFWLNLISPLSRNGDVYQDTNTTTLPRFFNPKAPFVDVPELEKRCGKANVLGSQWLPPMYREDRALVMFRGGACWECIMAAPGEEETPLLYALPLFDMSLAQPLSLPAGAAS
ncbi:hypothetical protein BerOc1_01998 [Pseudodesulfovibrio hydrargyri]|uniref:Uncharacterized protein n=1 Tax=Pseudodesulfovibrio hydrargyri TaxID=2125990 RepID=A0A1J5MW81_9BACT|nr:hypothetical protein [Pseudodesulfovibrio hydrargyri]OIQ50068.1 hypothetical protein BerOc1_01998 [Pseudodesulfovibrio hydrargyri]